MIEVKKGFYINGNIWHESHYKNGISHREDGPAYISNTNVSCKYYFKNGKGHREDGPARIIYNDGGNILYKEYCLNDKHLTEQEWFNQLSIENKLKFAFGIEND
jgi:antitoxin component YwqK of YwqJK toxin-antitoxin module